MLEFLLPTVIGGMFQSNAASKAANAQSAADAARLEEEKRVREQLRLDTEAQRAVADQAFADYNAGLISYAEAQQRAGEAMSNLQSSIGQSQLADTAKVMEMAKFQPYSIRTGTGRSFVDPTTGQAGFALSPETYGYQQDLYKLAGQQVGNINLGASPEQQAYQKAMYGGASMLAGNLPFQGTPEQQQYQQSMYQKAAEQAANLNLDPAAQAQKYYQQQQDILAGSRGAEDIAARQSALQRGRIGLGVSTEAAGAGAGGMVNPDEYARQLARAQADRQLAADASQRATADIQQQLQTTQGLFGSGNTAQDQIQRALANQLSTSQAMASGGAQSEAARQSLIGGQLSNASGMFSAAMAPEQLGLQQLQAGVNLGQINQGANMQAANLYSGGMSDYYRSMLGAGQTNLQNAQYVPQAGLTAAQEQYQRQQTALAGLMGNQLQYQPMTTPQATVPGSAYAMAGLGSGLMNAGITNIQKAFNTTGNYAPNYMTAWNYGTNPGSQQTSMLAAQDKWF